jgi:hypothetical protein
MCRLMFFPRLRDPKDPNVDDFQFLKPAKQINVKEWNLGRSQNATTSKQQEASPNA